MYSFQLFNSYLNINSEYCSKNGHLGKKIDTPYVNLYIRINNVCNANCKFCEFRGDYKPFDISKFLYGLEYISTHIKINKISFTGGEPTLNIPLFKRLVKSTRKICKDSFLIVNTNGVNLKQLEDLDLNSIALSRHHYLDEENNKILGFKAPSTENILNFKNKEILHLSCNLLKGKIDSIDEVKNYLEFCDSVGVSDVGLVSLMKVNDYCKDRFIDFNDIKDNINRQKKKNLFNNINWNKGNDCRCANYLYISNRANVIKLYSRYYCNSKNVSSQLVYDINTFKDGFNGKIIY